MISSTYFWREGNGAPDRCDSKTTLKYYTCKSLRTIETILLDTRVSSEAWVFTDEGSRLRPMTYLIFNSENRETYSEIKGK